MRTLVAFMKKEWMQQARSGKFLILLMLFVLFGIMNPAVAKLTPWLLETMSESMADSGMVITAVEVNALTSWTQFFKNIPMALIAFVLIQSSIFTQEYESGTLILALTKGLKRRTVLASKTGILFILWTAYYWMCYGITYAYNAYFWDNSIAENLIFSVVCWWVFGLWVLCLMILFSAIGTTNSSVMAETACVLAALYLVSLLQKIAKYLPTKLMDGTSLVYGLEEVNTYIPALFIVLASGVIMLMISIPILNKKRL